MLLLLQKFLFLFQQLATTRTRRRRFAGVSTPRVFLRLHKFTWHKHHRVPGAGTMIMIIIIAHYSPFRLEAPPRTTNNTRGRRRSHSLRHGHTHTTGDSLLLAYRTRQVASDERKSCACAVRDWVQQFVASHCVQLLWCAYLEREKKEWICKRAATAWTLLIMFSHANAASLCESLRNKCTPDALKYGNRD